MLLGIALLAGLGQRLITLHRRAPKAPAST
jgi:hypothetical protein